MTDPGELLDDVQGEIGSVLVGMDGLVEQLTVAALTRGHVLLEGVPGVAKTTLANAFARAFGLEYNRIQLTPDVLPADITGTTVYREQTGDFRIRRGPLFANVVVADEINRATPKTQSALLEGMAERQVSIEGNTLSLPEPFMIVATQNPIEMEGTYDLPEAQRDRFQQKLAVELPGRDTEARIVELFDEQPEIGPDDVEQVGAAEDLLRARDVVHAVHVAEDVRSYIIDLVHATRRHPDVAHGASPRASLALLGSAKAKASLAGRDYVLPDDVKDILEPIVSHRMVLTTEAELAETSASAVVEEVESSVAPPGSPAADDEGSPRHRESGPTEVDNPTAGDGGASNE